MGGRCASSYPVTGRACSQERERLSRPRRPPASVRLRSPQRGLREPDRSGNLLGMAAKPTTLKKYLAALPEDRRIAIEAICKVIRKNLDKKFVEDMQYGMPAYFLPH